MRPYLVGTTFRTVLDADGAAIEHFGFRVVPNGVLVDEDGVVRSVKEGSFSVEHADDVAMVERFIAGATLLEENDPTVAVMARADRELIATKVRRGRSLEAQGRRDDAIAEWRSALAGDPENFVIRKQIWAVEHPDRFHPTIDTAWQERQLRHERATECGPEGCPVSVSDQG